MARTVMLSDEIYEELTMRKELKGKSYSETIRDLLGKDNINTGRDLKKLLGVMKDEEGWDKHLKEMKEGWKRWSERYA